MDVLVSKAQPMQMRAIDIISVLLFYQNVEVCLMLFLVKLNIEKNTILEYLKGALVAISLLYLWS